MPMGVQLVALLAIMCVVAANAQDTTARDVYKKAVPSVVIVVAVDGNDQPTAIGF